MRLFVFDCDGTLVDSQHRILRSMERAARNVGLEPAPEDAICESVGLRLESAARMLYPDSDEATRAELLRNYREAFFDLSKAEGPEPLFEGCREALDQLTDDGELLAVATGKSRRGLHRVLEQHELLDRFVGLATADDGPSKPNPTILLQLLERCGVEASRALVIGDTSYDMEMARNAGVHGLGVAWGYHRPNRLLASGAAAVVDSFEGLPAAARNLLL